MKLSKVITKSLRNITITMILKGKIRVINTDNACKNSVIFKNHGKDFAVRTPVKTSFMPAKNALQCL